MPFGAKLVAQTPEPLETSPRFEVPRSRPAAKSENRRAITGGVNRVGF